MENRVSPKTLLQCYIYRKGVQFKLNALSIYIKLTNYFSPRLVAE